MNQKQLRCALAACAILMSACFIHGSCQKNRHDGDIAADTRRIADTLEAGFREEYKKPPTPPPATFFAPVIDYCGVKSARDICLQPQSDFDTCRRAQADFYACLRARADFFLKNTKDIDPCGAGSTRDACLQSRADFFLDQTRIKSDAESPRK